ncbi:MULTISPECIES: hypothetical protein [unclassified Pseudomonas]|uniref:hypothetical protein n=1 Tax=unclassified Pseudomonas TaxID=196821 RepID=UPI00244A6106|nr:MULTISPECIES: hypothetical protein [unclassified Pseudomonas]MDG9928260.1 hypothetical protein [Pseudomonas sp. GD04042]MDH0481176.1 hypothetical protein [Pseudomonas sp. GD04015]MDH0604512.1 hypothetical protein [Pseudomonas sp. GD03869]
MTMPRDVQSEVVAALQELLAPIARVEDGDVRAILDVEDNDLPDEFIVLQIGTTDERLQGAPRMLNSLPETAVINIVLVSKQRHYAATLRAMRLAVKVALRGRLVDRPLGVEGVSSIEFQQQTPTYPPPGKRYAAYVMPLQINYTQPLA